MPKLVMFVFLSLLCTFSHGITISFFGPSYYNANTAAMDASLGIDSQYTIEDFEDSNFVSGFSVQDAIDGSTTLEILSNYTWDGSHSFWTGNYSSRAIQRPIFQFDNPISSFGIGLYDAQNSIGTTYIYVNNVYYTTLSSLPNYHEGGCNGYIKIDAQSGESIYNIKFEGPSGDTIIYDHMVFKTAAAVPECSSLFLLSFVILIKLYFKK